MKKTIEAWHAHQQANKVQHNQLIDALISFDSQTWQCITKSCQKGFENATKVETSLDALILNYDIHFAIRAMYDYNGDNFLNNKELIKTGWSKQNSTSITNTKVKIEK